MKRTLLLILILLALSGSDIRKRYQVSGGELRPDQIANLTLWLDASDASTITESSRLVSAWSDKAGVTNNFTQATAANKPMVTGNSAAENRFGGSNDFDNATYWTLGDVTVDSNLDDCCGNANNGWTVTADNTSAVHRIIAPAGNRPIEVTATAYVLTAYLKYGNYQYVWLGLEGGSYNGTTFDMSAGTVSSNNNAVGSIAAAGNDWYLAQTVITLAEATGAKIAEVGFDGDGTASNGATTFAAAGTETFGLYNMQLRHNNTSPAFVETTTTPLYAGINGRKAVRGDWSNDILNSTSTTDTIWNAAAKTSAIVFRTDDVGSTYGMWGDVSGYFAFSVISTGVYRFQHYDSDNDTADVAIAARQVVVAIQTHDGTNITNRVKHTTASTASGNTGAVNQTLRILARGHDIAELVTYDRVLSGPEIKKLERYLCRKWGASC